MMSFRTGVTRPPAVRMTTIGSAFFVSRENYGKQREEGVSTSRLYPQEAVGFYSRINAGHYTRIADQQCRLCSVVNSKDKTGKIQR